MLRLDSATDMQRIGEGLARPGMDTRTWVSLAIVQKITVEKTGVICDIALLPDDVPETATYAPSYGGAGYGEHAPLEIDQMVVVVAPSGDPNHGLRIIARVWDEGEPPPQDVTDNPADHVLVVKAGDSYRVRTTGAGKVHVMSEQSVELKSGPDAPTQKLPLFETYRTAEDQLLTALSAFVTQINALAAALAVSAPPVGSPTDQGTTKTAATAINAPGTGTGPLALAAIDAFKAAAESYLARIGKVE